MEQVAWAAGYFDGEGSVSLHYSASRARARSVSAAYRFRLRCGTTDEPAVRLLAEILGGAVNEARPTLAGRRVWVWQIAGARAVAAARTLRPYAVVKRQRLDLFIEAWEAKRAVPHISEGAGSGRGSHHLDPGVGAILASYAARIAALNQKGPSGRNLLPELARPKGEGR